MSDLMSRKEAIKMLERIRQIGNGESPYKHDAQSIALDMAIEALSEPTIPLSVIEKMHDAIDNADADGDIEDDNGNYIGSVLTDYHVHEIIDKAVKEIRNDR